MSTPARLEHLDLAAPPVIGDLCRRSLYAGAVFAVAGVAGAVVSPAEFMHAYLLAYMFSLSPVLGSMALLMLWHLSGGEWGMVIRRTLEAAMGTLPLLAVLFVPILLGLRLTYAWARPEDLARSESLRRLAGLYLTPTSFLLHAVVFFLLWGLLAYYLGRWSSEQDRGHTASLSKRFRALSAAGILVYGGTMTLASVDWVMSLDPSWTSTIYALIFMVGQALFALCLCAIVGRMLVKRPPMSAVLAPHHFHDLGNLMLTFVMLWAYFNFSQWLIVWSGNLPEEIRWYLPRVQSGWSEIGGLLIVGQFALPFVLLLSRSLKKNSHQLALLASFLLLMRYVDLFWNIEPGFSGEHFHFTWLHVVVPVGMFGLWLAYFFWNLKRRPLVAAHDPQWQAFLEKQHE
jgi:hypothetical protein